MRTPHKDAPAQNVYSLHFPPLSSTFLRLHSRLMILRLSPQTQRALDILTREQRARFAAICAECEDHLADHALPNLPWAVSAALSPSNRGRNRYLNVFPWDRTRVKLPAPDHLDYINASWVDMGANRQYIAAQGPLHNTGHHFWAMCYQEAERRGCAAVAICMVTPLVEAGIEKCARYWPLERAPVLELSHLLAQDHITPALTVTWQSETAHPDGFVVTEMTLALPTTTKRVFHYAYLGWRDTRVPESPKPLLALSHVLSEMRAQHPGLVPIVHCSAGVGRTGTFIALDSWCRAPTSPAPASTFEPKSEEPDNAPSKRAAEMLPSHLHLTCANSTPSQPSKSHFSQPEEHPDDLVFQTVRRLRRERMMMVQTVHQYTWLYSVAKLLCE